MDKKIKFTQIHDIVESVLQDDWSQAPKDLESTYEADRKSRKDAEGAILRLGESR